jgi:hypothetical protein
LPTALGVTAKLPLVVSLPLHDPLAVQDDAFVVDHVSMALCPEMMLVGLTERVTVGAGVTGAVTVRVADALALPPAPVQVSV